MASKQTTVKKAQPEVEQKTFEQDPAGQTQIERELPKRTGTKMGKATAIYLELVKEGDHKRADFIKRFMSECDLSKAASSTYFQVLKGRHQEGKIQQQSSPHAQCNRKGRLVWPFRCSASVVLAVLTIRS